MIEMLHKAHGIDRDFNVHVAFDLAAAKRVGELLGRFGHHGVAVVVEPIDQWTDRGILLVLHKRCIVERSYELTLRSEESEETLIVDVEAKPLGGRVQVCAIDENRQTLIGIKVHHCNPFQGSIQQRGMRNRKAGWQPGTRKRVGQRTGKRNVLANAQYVIMPVAFTQRRWIQSPRKFLNRSGESSV